MRFFKYDVAISFGSEDIEIAKKIVDALELKGLKVYLYTEQNNAGNNLKKDIWNVYYEDSMFALAIISKNYAKGRWTMEEMEVIQTQPTRCESPYLIPVRVDDTKIDGLNPNIIYIDWKGDNENDIAEFVAEKVKKCRKIVLEGEVKRVTPWIFSTIGLLFFKASPSKERRISFVKTGILVFLALLVGGVWFINREISGVIELKDLRGSPLRAYTLRLSDPINNIIRTFITNNKGLAKFNRSGFGKMTNISAQLVSEKFELTNYTPNWELDTVRLVATERLFECVIELKDSNGVALAGYTLELSDSIGGSGKVLITNNLGIARFGRNRFDNQDHVSVRLTSKKYRLKNNRPDWSYDTIKLIGLEKPNMCVIELKNSQGKLLGGYKIQLLNSDNDIVKELTVSNIGFVTFDKNTFNNLNNMAVQLVSNKLKLKNDKPNWNLDTVRLIGLKIIDSITFTYNIRLISKQDKEPRVGVKVLLDQDFVGVTNQYGLLSFKKSFRTRPFESKLLFSIEGKGQFFLEHIYKKGVLVYDINELL